MNVDDDLRLPPRPTKSPSCFWGFVLLAALAVGCAEGDVDQVSTTENNITNPPADMGFDQDDRTDTRPEEDVGPDVQRPTRSTVAPSGGGAHLKTPNHEIRVIVGPRGSTGSFDTPGHRIRMGAGAVQHTENR